MDIIDVSGLWSITVGAVVPPPPPVTVTVGGGIIRDRILERIPKIPQQVKIPDDFVSRVMRRIRENELLEIFFISDDDV